MSQFIKFKCKIDKSENSIICLSSFVEPVFMGLHEVLIFFLKMLGIPMQSHENYRTKGSHGKISKNGGCFGILGRHISIIA